MTRNEWVGILVALVIGGIARLLRLPIPSPPTIPGALMVLGLTVGYLVIDQMMRR